MQKYKKLLLVVIACASLILMFTYRHKYSKLTLIFQMMNAFQFRDSETKYNEKLYEFKKSFKSDFLIQEHVSGLPYWTEIFPNIYAYSTFWEFGKTRTIVLARHFSFRTLSELKCKYHYKSEKHTFHLKFEPIILQKENSSVSLYIDCIPFDKQVPHSISFVHRNRTSVSLPVIHQESFTSRNAICVPPLPPAFDDVYRILEFMIYHSSLGVKLFIFYDTGSSLDARKLLLDLSNKNDLHVLLLPWNLPFRLRTKFNMEELHFFDCINRVLSRKYSNVVMGLNLNEFVVAKEHWNISKLSTDTNYPFNGYKFHVKSFCLEYPSDIIAQNLLIPFITLLKTRASNELKVVKQVAYDISRLNNTTLNFKTHNSWLLPESDVVLHSYNKCGLKSGIHDSSEDRSMWKYKDIFFQSHLYILAKDTKIIEN